MTASARVARPTVCQIFSVKLSFHVVFGSQIETDRIVSLALVVVVPKDKLTINGPTKVYSSPGSSGKLVHRTFCTECGSPIAHDPDAMPDIIALKGGTLDTEIRKNLKPVRT